MSNEFNEKIYSSKMDKSIQSLKKAEWYLDRLIALEETSVTPAESSVRMDEGAIGSSFYEQAKQTAVPDV